ncbi:MAG TPA: ATP-binding protein [Egibacteraceae bacterium]|nr:ATP-binding protein [Egibacteraceae bacterium]
MAELSDESRRLEALRALGVLDTPPEERFDRIARAAADTLGTPIALITLVDDQRQWFKARVGLPLSETPRSQSFCARAIDSPDLLVVHDAREDPRFADNPLVTGEPHIVFYAGAPVSAPSGERVGTVCVIGHEPRALSEVERRFLAALATWASSELAAAEVNDVLTALDRIGRRLGALLDAVPEAIVLVDGEGRLRSPNPATGRLLGCPAQEVEGTHWTHWLADGADARALFGVADDRRRHPRGELRLRCADGAEVPAEVTITREEVGEGMRLVIARSIKGQKDAQAALERLRRQNELILSSAHQAILGLDRAGVVHFANPSAHTLLGAPELIGCRLHEIFHSRHADGSPYPWEDCPSYATLTRGEFVRVDDEVFWRTDGTSFVAEYASAPIVEDGAVTGMVLTIDDVTVRKELERLKDELVGVVSHELRTPLTAIRGSLGILGGAMGADLSDRAARMVDIAVRGTDRMTRLVNDLLDLDRLRSGVVDLHFASCTVGAAVDEALESVRPQAEERGITIQREAGSEVVVRADHDRLLQCLVNLLANAVKFSPDGGTVRVAAWQDGGHGVVRVADEGRGIPAAQLEEIFERFRQVDPSDTRRLGGSGLGLAIVRRLAELHGGRVWAESVEGKGAAFLLRLPAPAQADSAQADLAPQGVDQPGD